MYFSKIYSKYMWTSKKKIDGINKVNIYNIIWVCEKVNNKS